MKPKTIRENIEKLSEVTPNLTPERAARDLKISEAECWAAYCSEGRVMRLQDDWSGQLAYLWRLGQVVAVNRSPLAIHEVFSAPPSLRVFREQALSPFGTVQYRIDTRHWASAFLCDEDPWRCLVFCDRFGRAAWKLFPTGQTCQPVWEEWKSRFASARQSPTLDVRKVEEAAEAEENVSPDVLLAAWKHVQDPYDLQALFEKLGQTELAALRLAGEPYGRRLSKDAVRRLLMDVAQAGLSIQVNAEAYGVQQSYNGVIREPEEFGTWLNVLHAEFNLHLDLKAVDTVWAVHLSPEPEAHTEVAVFDRSGKAYLRFRSGNWEREGQAPGWSEICRNLPSPDSDEL